ncbi:senescence-associated protein-domain-containing protein [Phlyctochytrium arcticum]|nr:senescence-associated protein-domain-containing protein [Phlyctochytrium arcticum]
MSHTHFTLPYATCSVVSAAGGLPHPLGTADLQVQQDPVSGSTLLSTAQWRLALPLGTTASSPLPGTFHVNIPSTARFDSTTLTYPENPASLKVELPQHHDLHTAAIFSSLFEDAPAYSTSDFKRPYVEQSPSAKTDYRNSIAVVDANGDVVGVVAQGVEVDDQNISDQPMKDTDSVVIELSSLPEVDLPPGPALPVHVKVLHGTSSSILTTGDYISTGILTTSSALSKIMRNGAESLKTLIPVATTEWHASEGTKRNIEKVNSASRTTADYTRRAAETFAGVAMSAGKSVANGASKVLPGTKAAADSRTGNAGWDVVKSAVHTVSTVLDAGVTAGKTLFDDTVEATAGIAQHRYGLEAGDAVRKSLGAVGNVGLVYFDAKGIGRRAILKHAAKGAFNIKLKDGRVVKVGETPQEAAATAAKLASSSNSTAGSYSSSSYIPPPVKTDSHIKKQ